MLYFLVNNNFHLIDADKHLVELKEYETSLIKIPHQLTISSNHSFNGEVEFPVLIARLKDYFNLPRIFKLHRKIKKTFKEVKSTDTLIFYTEFELLTHYIVTHFKKRKAKVILMEEGIPTYLTFTGSLDSSIPLKKKLLGYYVKYMLGYFHSKTVGLNNRPINVLSDNQIDQLLLYTNIKVRRNVPVALLESEKLAFKQLNNHTVLFLNEAMYKHYIDFNSYLTIIDDILANLSLKFQNVYFKFHPRETDEFKNEIRIIIKKHHKVSVVEDNQPVELMVEKIGAKYVTSFAAQTLLYLSNSNCIVLYLFHLYPKLMENTTLIQLKNVIDNMNYVSLNDWSEIESKTLGFTDSANSNKYKSLKEYLSL